MTPESYYRGGSDLRPKPRDVKLDRRSGLLSKGYGISVSSDPARVVKFGGAFRLGAIPDGLKIIQRGTKPEHFEVVPSAPMTFDDYAALLALIELTEVDLDQVD